LLIELGGLQPAMGDAMRIAARDFLLSMTLKRGILAS
jgi:hypothetical protein